MADRLVLDNQLVCSSLNTVSPSLKHPFVTVCVGLRPPWFPGSTSAYCCSCLARLWAWLLLRFIDVASDILRRHSLTENAWSSGSYNPSIPHLQSSLSSRCRGCITDASFRPDSTTLHFDRLWCPEMFSVLCKEKLPTSGMRTTLVEDIREYLKCS